MTQLCDAYPNQQHRPLIGYSWGPRWTGATGGYAPPAMEALYILYISYIESLRESRHIIPRRRILHNHPHNQKLFEVVLILVILAFLHHLPIIYEHQYRVHLEV